MSDVVIRAEGLGKCYLIQHKAGAAGYRRLSEELVDAAMWPFRRLWALLGNGSGPARLGGPATPRKENFWALQDVSFEVRQGEVLGVIGRNGAGKSTLLKVLSRITEPTEGRVRVRGRVASLLEVGTGFHPELTGRENIFLNGTILGMTRREIDRKFDEIVAFAEIEQFLDTPVKRYSSGMYVRLAFSVAAHLEPEILIVDEVLAVGDHQFQKKCLGKMQDVAARDGRTVLFVSHNMAAIQTLCGRAMLLERGRLRMSGGTQEVVEAYLKRSGDAGGGEAAAEVALGSNVVLRGIRVEPGIVTSGRPADFELELASREPTQVHELAILIYSELGTRVAVLDLRPAAGSGVTLSPRGVLFKGRIEAVPFVEGEYRIGMFLATGDYHGNSLDLSTMAVVEEASAEGFAPYPAARRGLVALKFSASVAEGARAAGETRR